MLYGSPHIPLSHSYVTATSLDARINAYDDSVPFSIEEIRLDDTRELELMSKFCIDMFFNEGNASVNDAPIASGWRNLKLTAMHKAQMMDFLMPTDGNRSIFVAKNQCSEKLVGCCEVTEERLDMGAVHYNESAETSQTRKRNARMKPIIENLSVHPNYRGKGIGVQLVHACENAMQSWIPKHEEIYAQVEEGNVPAMNLFRQCGYTSLFVDPACKKVSLDGTLFAENTVVSKIMFRKFLCIEDMNMQYFDI